MPSSATITAFYTFVANTKARASQTNVNFSTFRGHMIAVDPNTATLSDLNYDLGSTDYRWRAAYIGAAYVNTMSAREIYLNSNTTSSAAVGFIADTISGGAIRARVGGTTVAVINSAGFQGSYVATGTMPLTSMISRGTGFTTAAALWGVAASGDFDTGEFMTTASTEVKIAGSTCTLICSGSRPVMVMMQPPGGGGSTDMQVTINTISAVNPWIRVDTRLYMNAGYSQNTFQALIAYPTSLTAINPTTSIGYIVPNNHHYIAFPPAGTTTVYMSAIIGSFGTEFKTRVSGRTCIFEF